MSQPQTTWAGKGTPFIGQPDPAPAKPEKRKPVATAHAAEPAPAGVLRHKLRDGVELVVTGEPWQPPRSASGELDGLFLGLGYNQRIKLPERKVKTVAEALRAWCKRHKVAACVRTKRDCGDGSGGVWMTALDGKKGGKK